ncbi:MAG: hypothetical protein L6V93_04255 [Clostridiales bacterium]|nr:MAG: hypothetical protein L6V93_04255 [Clostridiales bacterium]
MRNYAAVKVFFAGGARLVCRGWKHYHFKLRNQLLPAEYRRYGKIAAALEVPTEYIVSGRGEKSIYDCEISGNFVNIPVYTGNNYMDIMQIGNDAKCDTLTLPCLPQASKGRFIAVCAPDNYMDGEQIQKGDPCYSPQNECFGLRHRGR